MMVFRCLAAAAGLVLSTAASSATLDFSPYPKNSSWSDALVVDTDDPSIGPVTLDNYLDREITFVDAANDSLRVFCFEKQFGCGMSGAMHFSTAVTDLSFIAIQTSELSNIQAQAYDGTTLLSSLRWDDLLQAPGIAKSRVFDFGSIGPVTRIVLNSLGDTTFYGGFSFDAYRATSAPEPSSLWLMVLGLVCFGEIRRRARSAGG